MRVIEAYEAKELGFAPLTTAYNPGEEWMLEATLVDMERGNVEHAPVNAKGGVEVWRRGIITLPPESNEDLRNVLFVTRNKKD